jgi:hypothetical protein
MLISFQKVGVGGGGVDGKLDCTLLYTKFLGNTEGKAGKGTSRTEIFRSEAVIQPSLIKQENTITMIRPCKQKGQNTNNEKSLESIFKRKRPMG